MVLGQIFGGQHGTGTVFSGQHGTGTDCYGVFQFSLISYGTKALYQNFFLLLLIIGAI
jgi:hypothetical protein